MFQTNKLSLTVFSASINIALQIDEMDIGVVTSTEWLAGEELWETYNFNERRVLDRFVEDLVVEELVPLKRAGFLNDGQILYQKVEV